VGSPRILDCFRKNAVFIAGLPPKQPAADASQTRLMPTLIHENLQGMFSFYIGTLFFCFFWPYNKPFGRPGTTTVPPQR